MTITVEDVVSQRPRFRSTLVALEIEAHMNDDPWVLGDALVDDTADLVPALDERVPASGRTGLYQRLDDIQKEMLEAGALTVAKSRASLRKQQAASRAWPKPYRRPDLATWSAHAAMVSKQYADGAGVEVLEHLHKHNKGRRVSEVDIRMWRERQERAKGKKLIVLTHEDKLDHALRAAIRRWATPQTVAQLTEGNLRVLTGTLRQILNEVQAGEFK